MLKIITVLSFTQRQAILYDNKDGEVMMAEADDYAGNDSDWEDEVLDGLHKLPPGKEGFLQSHAGGEAVLQAVMDHRWHYSIVSLLVFPLYLILIPA